MPFYCSLFQDVKAKEWGGMREIARRNCVPYSTFSRHYWQWRECADKDNFTIKEARGGKNRKLDEEQEKRVYERVCSYINNDEFINSYFIAQFMRNELALSSPSLTVISPSTVHLFKKKYRLSSLTPSYAHTGKMTELSKWHERKFMRDVLAAYNSDEYDIDNIYNMDEFFARTFPFSHSKVIGHTNSSRQGRRVETDINEKEGIHSFKHICIYVYIYIFSL